MSALFRAGLVALLAVLLSPARAQGPRAPIEGVFEAEDGSHRIALYLGDGLEVRGRIVWTEARDARDANNPNPALRARPVVGLEHLRGLRPAGDDTWCDGVLYNPEDGKTYDACMRLSGSTLRVRARPRIAVFGRLLGALFGRIDYIRVSPVAGGGKP